MQRNIIVRADSGIAHPRDLAGKKVGSRLTIVSGTVAGIMLMLEQGYGVGLADLIWHCGDPTKLPDNRLGLALKRGADTDEENFQLLLGGALDAVVVTTGPRYWSLFGGAREDEALARFPGLRPLTHDAEAIAQVYRRTGLYPITDTGVVSANLLEGDPALPRKLVEAFSRANDLAAKYRSAEEERLARRELQLLGEDPHRYGLGENQRKNIAAFLDLLARMGALPKYLEPEQLFVPSTRDL
jgi:4,5-dihydroxyphthalate decarboxylase